MSENQTLLPDVASALESFTHLEQKIMHYQQLLGLVQWDLQSGGTPRKGQASRAEAIGALTADTFELFVSEEMGACLDVLTKPENNQQLDAESRARVRVAKKEYDKTKNIPSSMNREFSVLTAKAHHIWEEARSKNQFSLYEESLTKIVDFQRQFAEYYGYEGHPYNALLNNYEPGLNVEKLDLLFSDLRQKTIQLLDRIQASPHKPQKEIFEQKINIEQQKEFNKFILPKLNFDLDAGRLDESVHPFAIGLSTGDVRMTTRYLEEDVRSAIFSTMHECGHGLYEQGVHADYNGTFIQGGASMGIHESQSRFLENIVGRSLEFWTYFYEDLKAHFPQHFDQVSLEEFTRAINLSEPSLIRVEADELTYNLHIMIRYEIEKGLIGGQYEVKDLPQIWNEKMQDYLGITPSTDSEGVLQDVHWSFGGFGYFPSYCLGNLYAAQIAHTIKQQIPDFDQVIANGEFDKIRGWLLENIHQYGKLYTPGDLIVKVTGEELNAKYLVEYLEQKYTEVYKL
ncbi:carboxypeptidase M32 [Bacillus horti]|uniref:Metal-dependent carboxypeptidase n=1 Tax=Caldalkalibacillus horti TaxID=77523 RepID=A0ABT9VXF9_9BACI|nr:carboxypeptidase M32 [Bacillus horti]MDQ0165663.1 carboxypeptidase Taq [Bacillus horti]